MSKKITIAIDGFSSTGKSTIAKQLAKHLGYVYVDTGAMYRAVTYFAMQNGYIAADFFDKQTLINSLSSIKLHFEFNPEFGFAEMYLNDANIEKEIRPIEMGKGKGIVMDGRDIGTVVFPKAELKIFMTASSETRARRRFDELQSKGQEVSFEEVLKNVEQRDYIDTHRDDSPLLKADSAIEIDNSYLTREEQFDAVLEMVNEVTK